jgi:hypothetical protein
MFFSFLTTFSKFTKGYHLKKRITLQTFCQKSVKIVFTFSLYNYYNI